MKPSCVGSATKLRVEEEGGGGAACLKVAGSNNIHFKDIGVSTRVKDKKIKLNSHFRVNGSLRVSNVSPVDCQIR